MTYRGLFNPNDFYSGIGTDVSPSGEPGWPQHPGQRRRAAQPCSATFRERHRDPAALPSPGLTTTAKPLGSLGLLPCRTCPAQMAASGEFDASPSSAGHPERPPRGQAGSPRSLPPSRGCNTWVCKPIFYLISRERVSNSVKRERAKDARLGFHPVPRVHSM